MAATAKWHLPHETGYSPVNCADIWCGSSWDISENPMSLCKTSTQTARTSSSTVKDFRTRQDSWWWAISMHRLVHLARLTHDGVVSRWSLWPQKPDWTQTQADRAMNLKCCCSSSSQTCGFNVWVGGRVCVSVSMNVGDVCINGGWGLRVSPGCVSLCAKDKDLA